LKNPISKRFGNTGWSRIKLKTMKVFFSLGDISAENILYHLLPHLPKDWEIYAITGKKTERLLKSVGKIEDITATGVFEVLPKLGRILKTKKRVKDFIKREKPDLVVLMDAPGFNLPLAKEAKKLGAKKVVYFVLPQVWAWKENRKYILAEYCDALLSILPFEEQIFRPIAKGNFFYVGHPSVEILEKNLKGKKHFRNPKGDYFVIFPGSRKNEIKKHLKVLKETLPIAVKEFSLPAVLLTFREFKELLKPLRLLAKTVYLDSEPQRGYEILANARFGWIKSGTTAFETALLGTPHLMYYRVNPLTYLIAKKLVKVPYLHLANLVLDEEVVPELVQNRFTPKRLLKETYRLLEKEEYQKTRFEELKELLKPPEGSVFENVARILEEVGKGKL
jgi:lipid-A-disaccharide synthase